MSEQKSVEHVKEYIAELVKNAKIAQKEFEHKFIDQRSVDEVVRATGMAVLEEGENLAKEAVKETGMGDVTGKLYKMMRIGLPLWNFMKGKPSVGYLPNNPEEPGVRVLAKPLGVIGCVMPSTNPIATVIGNSMCAFKCRNSVIIAPHPASARASQLTVECINIALKKVGAPANLIQCISPDEASIEATNELLKQCDVNIATGGAGMVKSVYSSGRPAFGVGQGNCQEIIDEDWDNIGFACKMAVANRSFDLGVPCTGDQTMHVPAVREEEYIAAMKTTGAYLLDEQHVGKLRTLLFPDGGAMNRKVVGKSPYEIGKLIDVEIPKETPVIFLKNQAKGTEDFLCKEILCPIIRYTTYTLFEDAVNSAILNLEYEGAGHSSSIWSSNQERIDYAANLIPVGRFHVNQPTGGAKNGVPSSITIGCGSWGNNSISENLQYYHLMNKTRVSVPLNNLREATMDDWNDFEPYNYFNE